MKMIANYHSHTFRCGHARGSDEEYAAAGYEEGLKRFGFSDHVILPDLSEPGMRGDPSLLEDYLSSVSDLKQKYAGKMEILTGFECEWFGSRYEDYYKSLRSEKKMDYLLLGQHCYLEADRFVWYARMVDVDQALDLYADHLIAGMESGLFLYVCHPDLFMSWYPDWNHHTREVSHRIAKTAVRLNIPLEINMGPKSRSPRLDLDDAEMAHYPYPLFWDIAAEEGVSAIIGVDAHLPSIYHDVSDKPFFEFAKRHHLKLIDGMNLLKKEEK